MNRAIAKYEVDGWFLRHPVCKTRLHDQPVLLLKVRYSAYMVYFPFRRALSERVVKIWRSSEAQ